MSSRKLSVLGLFLSTCFFTTFSFSNESSVFGTGDLEQDSTYGLTNEEKKILHNKQDIQKLKKSLSSLKYQTSNISDKLESLRTNLTSINNLTSQSKLETRKQLSLLSDVNSSYVKLQKIVGELSGVIDNINSTYISREEFEIAFRKLESKLFALQNQDAKYNFNSNNYALLKEAKKLFSKKRYNASKLRFAELIERRFKPAQSNYYLGEISFYQKLYAEAIVFYKTSFSLYDKADYTPNLLLHTGKSLQKLKENKKANKFFSILKDRYPNSKEAREIK